MPPKKKGRGTPLPDVPRPPEESRWTRTVVRGDGVGQWAASDRKRAGLWSVNLNYYSGGLKQTKFVSKRDGLYESAEEVSFAFG